MISQENKKLTITQRKENLEKGPHNLIFHGMEPDWIEAEMDDDPDFIKDVIGQRMRNMIKDEVIGLSFILFDRTNNLQSVKIIILVSNSLSQF